MPTLLCGSKTQTGYKHNKSRVRAVRMNFLRRSWGVRRIDELLWNLCGVEKNLNEEVEKSLLRWYRHVARMDEVVVGKKLWLEHCRIKDSEANWLGICGWWVAHCPTLLTFINYFYFFFSFSSECLWLFITGCKQRLDIITKLIIRRTLSYTYITVKYYLQTDTRRWWLAYKNSF